LTNSIDGCLHQGVYLARHQTPELDALPRLHISGFKGRCKTKALSLDPGLSTSPFVAWFMELMIAHPRHIILA
jgi:hypothetical protein